MKKLLLLTGIIALSIIAFLINAATKNVDIEGSFTHTFRSLCIISSFALIFFYLKLIKKEKQKGIVQQIGAVAMWAGLFLLTYLIISFLPLKGFETRDLKLFPRDYLTIFFSSIVSLVASIFAVSTLLHQRELIHYRRKKNTARNFYLFVAALLAASGTAFSFRPLEDSTVESVLSAITILFIIVNSFRLAWIAYLPRREKVYALLYSILAFFGFLAILVILSVQDGWTQKGLLYYSYPLFIFVQLTSIFGAVYFGMSFISTLFHLPTAEAFDKKQTEISSLHNLNRLITQVFDLKDLANTATKLTFEVIDAACVWLEIVSQNDNEHQLISNKNISEEEINSILHGGNRSLRTFVLESKKYLLIDDVENDRRTHHLPKMKKLGSMIIVPLLSHEKVIGVLYATKEIEFGFEQEDIDVLSGFADQVAIAIENARLIERSLEKERLQRELMLAQEMQKRLLPQKLPEFSTVDMRAVSSPALEVGGDYYDVARIDEHCVGIVIGDVSGKGVGAAFYMAEVKGIFQSLSKIYSSPKEFLIKANESLVPSIDKRSFISLIYSTINIATGELALARAGHCPMLYVSEKRKEYIKPLGLGLGIISGEKFSSTIQEEKITMKPGDVCVFYTDGVTESRSSDGEEFGYERLYEVVEKNRARSAEEIKEEIIQTVWNYTDAKGYHDDLTIFVLKWIGE